MRSMTVLLLLTVLAAPAAAFESSDCLILPSSEIELGATVPGLLAEVSVDRGDQVNAGQIVALLRSEIQEATLKLAVARAENEAGLKAAEARLNFERQELERAEGLLKRRVIAQQAMDERRTAYQVRLRELEEAQADAGLAKLEVLRAEAELEVRRIRSPISGIVIERSRDAGEYLRDDGSVLKVAQLDPLHVEVFLPQKMYPKMKSGDTIPIRLDLGTTGLREATITVIDPVIDAASATFGVRMELPNPGLEVIAGIRCTAEFAVE